MFVDELWFDSCASMLGVLGFLRNFEGNQKVLSLQNIPEQSPLLHYLPDLKNCDIRLRNTGSARVLNVEKVLRAHRYPPRGGAFTIQIGDDVFRVVYTENDVLVEKDSAYAPDAVMAVNTASQILLSGITDEAYIPGLEIRNPASDLFRAFLPKTTFFTDPF